MAQATQIVPKFSFPYVETVINNNTVVTDSTPVEADDKVKYVFAFAGPKGIDNRWVRKSTLKSFKETYGTSNYKKYGQPMMMPLSILENNEGDADVWCMRVMPENAVSSHRVVSLFYKADTAEEVSKASERKFRIKFLAKADSTGAIKSKADLEAFAAKTTGDADVKTGLYKDAEGYTEAPGFISFRSMGRGVYGDDYRVRISQSLLYENEYGIKMYSFEVISSQENLNTIAEYVGCLTTSSKYDTETLINDIIDDTDDGVAPVDVRVSEEAFEQVYDAYVEFVKQQYIDLQAELTDMKAQPEGTYTDEQFAAVEALISRSVLEAIPDQDCFDPLFGRGIYKNAPDPFLAFPEALTADIDQSADDFNSLDYTASDIVEFDSVECVRLKNGDDGYFAKPRTVRETVYVNGVPNTQDRTWTLDEEYTDMYKKAYSGDLDRRILSPRRIEADALFDANYDLSVKNVLADLAILRNDAPLYLDTGIIESYSASAVGTLIKDFSAFVNPLIIKNLHHYYIKEPKTKKRVPVTITYYLANGYCKHIKTYGTHIPYVNEFCRLSGHVKDSLTPSIEQYETDLMEKFAQNRFNYFETLEDNVFQRAIQNTSDDVQSDLLEENNVATLYLAKRIVEKDLKKKMYNFTDADERQAFRKAEQSKFADWINKKVASFDIKFKMNAWEAERNILHAYIEIVFRGLQKQAILEIDINKRTFAEDEEE